MSACGTRHRAGDRTLAEGSPVVGGGVQPGRAHPGRRRLERPCRPVGCDDRARDRHPGRGQPGRERGVQPGRAHPGRGDYAGNIGLWDVATRRKTASLLVGDPSGSIHSVAFSPDGHTVAAGVTNDDTGFIGAWDTATGQPTATLADAKSLGRERSLQPGRGTPWPPATTTATSSSGMPTGPGKTATLADGSTVESVAFKPDGTAAAGDDNGHIILWDAATGRMLPWPTAARSRAWPSAQTGRSS